MTEHWLDEITWNQDGLIPVITQDAHTQTVLMLAWMNREALRLTVEKQQAVYWSRSRGKLWFKGEQSGHIQKVLHIRLDCDKDTLLLAVEQSGGIACHTGRQHCFYHQLQGQHWNIVEQILKDPTEIYSS
ncbi:MAG: phosphoribosyl-AMP cyclohydrolase [Pseudomonadota bacterium]|nr:phosphoribosyl-AMP cyclohydrolase [Pseudomonadota bacterium]